MRSFNRSPNARRFFPLLIIAALVLVSRAPFLLQGERFFDSDEAVEGLMALHVLDGEFPAFLWGQRYKGVPEVYLAAAVFAAAGPSVVALKAVTLVCFALFVCLQFVLVTRLFSRSIAWMATAFLIVCPPALVLWSLSANAEVVMTLLAGTVMGLGLDVWRRTGSRAAFLTAAAAAGFGLWVHQYIVYYWIALALAVVHWLPQRRAILQHLLVAREIPRWLRVTTGVLAAAALGYIGLGTVAFLTGGFDMTLAGIGVGVRHAQKLWQIAAALAVLAAGARIYAIATRQSASMASLARATAAAFVAGYAPALAAQATGGGAPPLGQADLAGVAGAMSSVIRDVIPIVVGFKSPNTVWLDVPAWLAAALGFAAGASLLALRQRAFTPLFHYLIVVTPIVFLLSGAFVDAQSYRYLMPMAGALAVVCALGVWLTFQRSRVAGAVVFVALIALFGLQQRAWYRQLVPDVQSRAIVACLDQAGVRAASADYWLAYKLTFLTGERIIVAPHNGVDRYPSYTTRVQAHPEAPRIPDTMVGTSCTQEPSSLR